MRMVKVLNDNPKFEETSWFLVSEFLSLILESDCKDLNSFILLCVCISGLYWPIRLVYSDI